MSAPTGNRPDLNVFIVTGSAERPFWTKVGGAWKNSKGGFSVELNALPTNGKLVLLPPKEDESAG